MPNSVKMDQRAFNRGVDEVLLLKPVRRVAAKLMSSMAYKPDAHQERYISGSSDLSKVSRDGKAPKKPF